MSSTEIPDHDTFWGDTNDVMKIQTRAYAHRVSEALNGGFLLRQYWHPWRQDIPYKIRCTIKVHEFMGDHHGIKVFDDPKEMLLYYENSSKNEEPKQTNRRLFIVEDLHPRLMEILGVLLDIPPEFFLAHCEEFPSLSVSNPSGTALGSSSYWKVPVPRRYDLPRSCCQPPPDGQYYAKLGNFNRGETPLGKGIQWVGLTSVVSYWGKPYGKDSWTSVVLIDPHRCKLESKWAPTISLDLVDCNGLRDITREFRLGSSFDKIVQSHKQRIYDATVDAYDNHKVNTTKDPFSSTIFVRNIVRSIWEEFVYRQITDVHDVQINDEQNQYKKRGSKSSRDYHDAPSYEKYHGLMVKRQKIREKKRDLQNIMWNFQCKIRPEGRKDGSESATPEEKENEVMAQREHQAWAFLEERLEAAETTLGNHLEMFAQRSALVQAEAANRMARSSGQLTKIATVIVPCSFVASIFSMGGKFEAGESLFFVYWTISVPMTLVLLAWVLAKDEDSIDFFKQTLSPFLRKRDQTQGGNGTRRRWGWFKAGSREKGHESGTP
ncbi:hypothetical protein QX201_010000 [Fusarium graminearum]